MINRKGQKKSFSESWMFLLFSHRAVKHLFQLIGGGLKKIPPPPDGLSYVQDWLHAYFM